MAVQINDPSEISYNKGNYPDPQPNETLYPIKKVMTDGREVWISLPQIDNLSIIIPITGDVFPSATAKSMDVESLIALLDATINNPPFKLSENLSKGQYLKSGALKSATMAFGKRDTRVWFEILRKKGSARLKLAFNPRKLGQKGMSDLSEFLALTFDVPKALAKAEITKADLAVDVVGLHISEVAAFHSTQGKRLSYLGHDGDLETLYIFGKKHPFKQKSDQWGPLKAVHPDNPMGTLRVRIYDKVRERQAIGQKPPFGDCPVTRIEIIVPKHCLTDLPSLCHLPDQFKKLRVGYVKTQMPASVTLWPKFHSICMSHSAERASEILNLNEANRKAFASALKVQNDDLVGPGHTWSVWTQALATSSVSLLIQSCPVAGPVSA